MAAAVRSGNVRSSKTLNVAIIEETKELLAGIVGERLINLMSEEWIASMAGKLPDSLLTSNDTRLKWAMGAGIFAGALGLQTGERDALQNFLVQSVEEIGKRSAELDARDMDKNKPLIRESMAKHKSGLEALRAKKDQGNADQKKALPDYFTAKAAIKDEKLRVKLSEVERALKDDKYVELRKLLPVIESALTSNKTVDRRKALTDIKLVLEQTKRIRLHEKLPAIELALTSDKDDDRRKALSDIKLVLKDEEYDPDAFRRFLRKGAYRIKTTPDELTEIAKASMTDITYGVERLKGLMAGERGEGGVASKLKKLGEDLLDDVLQGDGTGTAAERLNAKVTASRALVQAATARNRRVD